MGAIDLVPDDELERDAERVRQATWGMGKVLIDVFPHGVIIIGVTSRAVKKQIEELLGTLGLQSPYEVIIRRSYPHPGLGRVRVKKPE